MLSCLGHQNISSHQICCKKNFMGDKKKFFSVFNFRVCGKSDEVIAGLSNPPVTNQRLLADDLVSV